jgi:hypothetical protein
MSKLIFSFVFLAAALAQAQSPSESPAAKPLLPIGTVIQCSLVFTIDSTSAKVKTPVIGTVQKDVVQAGKMVIPKGTIATCVLEQPVAFRDRIAAEGKWHLTDPGGNNIGEFDGVACDREADPKNEEFGPSDGSAGLRGSVTGNKLAVADKPFIRVEAGKEFYVVVTDQSDQQIVCVEHQGVKKDDQQESDAKLPPGIKIPCTFVYGVNPLVDNQNPVAAVVSNDVWWEGRKVLPKGTRIDAIRQPMLVKDRVEIKGLWVITTGQTGYFVDGQALQRDQSSNDGSVGVLTRQDGNAFDVPAGQGFYFYLESPLQVSMVK